MIPRRGLAARFERAVRRLGKHKAARVQANTSLDYGNMWGVAMEWGVGATRLRHGVRLRPFRRRRRGGMLSPDRIALEVVRKLAAWRRGKRVMRKLRAG